MRLRFPDQIYPKFDLNRFSQYLARGLVPFLIDFVLQFLINFPLQISFWLCIGLVAAAGNSQSQLLVVVAGVGVPLIILIDVSLLIALNLLIIPVTIRGGLSQDFNQTFKFAWIKDFLRKVGLQALLFNLFLMAVASVLIIPGYLACCVGMFAVAFYLMGPVLAHHHLQLYRLYLARGGEPIRPPRAHSLRRRNERSQRFLTVHLLWPAFSPRWARPLASYPASPAVLPARLAEDSKVLPLVHTMLTFGRGLSPRRSISPCSGETQ